MNKKQEQIMFALALGSYLASIAHTGEDIKRVKKQWNDMWNEAARNG